MTQDEAKEIIRNDPDGDILKRLDAIDVALEVLGSTATIREIYEWATKDCKN